MVAGEGAGYKHDTSEESKQRSGSVALFQAKACWKALINKLSTIHPSHYHLRPFAEEFNSTAEFLSVALHPLFVFKATQVAHFYTLKRFKQDRWYYNILYETCQRSAEHASLLWTKRSQRSRSKMVQENTIVEWSQTGAECRMQQLHLSDLWIESVCNCNNSTWSDLHDLSTLHSWLTSKIRPAAHSKTQKVQKDSKVQQEIPRNTKNIQKWGLSHLNEHKQMIPMENMQSWFTINLVWELGPP